MNEDHFRKELGRAVAASIRARGMPSYAIAMRLYEMAQDKKDNECAILLEAAERLYPPELIEGQRPRKN